MKMLIKKDRTKVYLDRQPDEMWIIILENLYLKDFLRLEMVSRSIRATVKRLAWKNCRQVQWNGGSLKDWTHEKSFDKREITQPAKLLKLLEKVGASIRYFGFLLPNPEPGDTFPPFEYSLSNMFTLLNHNLAEIELLDVGISGADLILLSTAFPNLRSIQLRTFSLKAPEKEATVRREDFSLFLANYSQPDRQLERLHIGDNHDLTFLGFENVPRSLTHFNSLDTKLHGKALGHLAERCRQMEHIRMSFHPDLSPEDVKYFFKHITGEIKHLEVSGFIVRMPYAFDVDELFNENTLANLQEFTVCSIFDGNFWNLTEPLLCVTIVIRLYTQPFIQLKTVNIYSNHITDDIICGLAKLNKLESLTLWCDSLTGEGLLPISAKGILLYLSIRAKLVKEATLLHFVQNCKKLATLEILHTIPNESIRNDVERLLNERRCSVDSKTADKCVFNLRLLTSEYWQPKNIKLVY